MMRLKEEDLDCGTQGERIWRWFIVIWQTAFFLLKLTGIVDWSWFIIAMPIWGPVIGILLLIAIAWIVTFITTIISCIVGGE